MKSVFNQNVLLLLIQGVILKVPYSHNQNIKGNPFHFNSLAQANILLFKP